MSTRISGFLSDNFLKYISICGLYRGTRIRIVGKKNKNKKLRRERERERGGDISQVVHQELQIRYFFVFVCFKLLCLL